MCSLCGDIAHGRADCHSWNPDDADPPWCWTNNSIDAAPPPSAAPAPAPAKKRKAQPAPPKPSAAPAAELEITAPGPSAAPAAELEIKMKHEDQPHQSKHEDQSSLGFKGCDAKGNGWVLIDHPCVVGSQPAAAGKNVSSSSQCAAPASARPFAIAVTAPDIQQWLETFTPFQPQNEFPPAIGQQILWEHTKTEATWQYFTGEYFTGIVNEIHVNEAGETYYYVSLGAVAQSFQIHSSHVLPPSADWMIGPGGRCYKRAQLEADFQRFVRCPVCRKQKWFRTLGGYMQHYDSVHCP